MRIAIVGSGLCGLATAWFILNKQSHGRSITLTIYDSKKISEGTSGMAAGLMHPFAGAPAKLNQHGWEAYEETCKLIEISSKMVKKPVAVFSGIQRIAITEKQKKEYRASSNCNKEVLWCESNIVGVMSFPGLFIPSCVTVDCPQYLRGLWLACEEKGAIFEQTEIQSLEQLKEVDLIILATGALVNQLLDQKLPITQVKGQILEMRWPSHLDPLPYAVNSIAYAIMENKEKCIVGATYERGFETLEPNMAFASGDILPKIRQFIPDLDDSLITGCRAGVRASGPNHMPLIKKINAKCWAITGMGSKGLLYHALFAHRLVNQLMI